ncbi:unnamed protein product [Ceratitis capitata]|uniref:(Mediterranean fruit fly) hypothetical protein n=1 Tax=Ceratitis capitata TaxID=7213 RepID=A0A811UXR2_CERCA|nr:unnamed protein product [Ceratitis capitata]
MQCVFCSSHLCVLPTAAGRLEMSISPSPSPDNLRICLVGDIINDEETVEAARSFNVPVITSENGLDALNDFEWRTFFVLKDFEGPIYDAIHKNKQW